MSDVTEQAPAPGPRIGVLGGGQLGRMLGLAGLPLGFRFVFLDPAEDACAGAVGDLLTAGFGDAEAARTLAGQVDLATFDFENVPADTARALEEICPLLPGSDALAASQDRMVEKYLVTELGAEVPGYHRVASRTDLLEGIERLGFPAVLKTRRLGYDGKGQCILQEQEDLERAWQKLGENKLVLEAFVPFEAECSLVAVRGRNGEIRSWPLTRNIHSNGILALSRPGVFDARLQARALTVARQMLEHLDYVGVLTIEFFLQEGRLLVNEFAPRVHNSGHWTIDGSSCSQFENHLRAIAGLSLGECDQTAHCLMFNWIGAMPDRAEALRIPGLHWHDYGKQARPGRKIGHATLTAADAGELESRARRLATLAGGSFPALVDSLFD
jgi:5-(carboxyamino)imidazole ribonucleotide synthase